ncbi:MAG: ABC transporter permease [Planctomycetota bacterium]
MIMVDFVLKSAKHFWPATVSVLVLLLVWEVVARQGFIHISLFPPPSHVVEALQRLAESGELWRDIKASLVRAFCGLGIGSAVGVVVGLVTGRIRILDRFITPLVQLFRPLPPVAVIPLVIVWFGIGEASKVFSIAFAVFFPVWINTYLGAKQIPRTYLWSAETFNAHGFWLFLKVIFPGSLSFVVAGVRNGIAVAFIMVFVAELAGASAGIGYQISVSHLAYRVDRMIGSLVVLGLCGACADLLFTKSLWFAFPWLKLGAQK